MNEDLFDFLDLEFKVDDLALSLLGIIDEKTYSQEVKNIYLQIMSIIKDKSQILVNLNCLGNLGIALRSIINNGLITSNKIDGIFVIINSYYCLTKHIHEPFMFDHPLLHINRALLMCENLRIFKMKNDKLDDIFISHQKEHVILSIAHKELLMYSDFNTYTQKRVNDLTNEIVNKFGAIIEIEEKYFYDINCQYLINIENMIKQTLKIIS